MTRPDGILPRELLGVVDTKNGSCRHGYGPPVFARCGTCCAYCRRELGAPYEAWLDISVDHVIPEHLLRQLGWQGRHDLARWVSDAANLVTCCRACNEGTNHFWRKSAPRAPATLEEFFNLRDRAHREKREDAQRYDESERTQYGRWLRSRKS